MHALKRQLRDIQIQADKLLNSHPEMEDIETFVRYSDELCHYLLLHTSDSFVIEKVLEVPRFEDLEGKNIGFSALMTILIVLSLGLLMAYAREQQRISAALNVVRDIRGKFGSIEFLLKNQWEG